MTSHEHPSDPRHRLPMAVVSNTIDLFKGPERLRGVAPIAVRWFVEQCMAAQPSRVRVGA